MKRIVLSLFVILSVVFVPLAHVTGMDCDEDASHHSSESEKQDSGKVTSAHHCCVSPMVDRADAKHAVALFTISTAYVVPGQADFTSVTVGPLLEPPSHA